MNVGPFAEYLNTAMQFMSALFVFSVGMGVLVVIVLFVFDITQTKHAFRRNYPVIGR